MRVANTMAGHWCVAHVRWPRRLHSDWFGSTLDDIHYHGHYTRTPPSPTPGANMEETMVDEVHSERRYILTGSFSSLRAI